MMRRFAAPTTTRIVGKPNAVRNYYIFGYGEHGIWGATMSAICNRLLWFVPVMCYSIYRVVHSRNSPSRQWIYGPRTDLYFDDGTELEGEEAVANLKIHYERIMPFMNEYKDKIEAAGGSVSS